MDTNGYIELEEAELALNETLFPVQKKQRPSRIFVLIVSDKHFRLLLLQNSSPAHGHLGSAPPQALAPRRLDAPSHDSAYDLGDLYLARVNRSRSHLHGRVRLFNFASELI